MSDDNLIGNLVGAGVTLMVADRVLRPMTRPRRRTKVIYRARRRKRL